MRIRTFIIIGFLVFASSFLQWGFAGGPSPLATSALAAEGKNLVADRAYIDTHNHLAGKLGPPPDFLSSKFYCSAGNPSR